MVATDLEESFLGDVHERGDDRPGGWGMQCWTLFFLKNRGGKNAVFCCMCVRVSLSVCVSVCVYIGVCLHGGGGGAGGGGGVW